MDELRIETRTIPRLRVGLVFASLFILNSQLSILNLESDEALYDE